MVLVVVVVAAADIWALMLPSNEAIIFRTFGKHGQPPPHSSATRLDALDFLFFAELNLLYSLAAKGKRSAGSAGSTCFLEYDLCMVNRAYIGQQPF